MDGKTPKLSDFNMLEIHPTLCSIFTAEYANFASFEDDIFLFGSLAYQVLTETTPFNESTNPFEIDSK